MAGRTCGYVRATAVVWMLGHPCKESIESKHENVVVISGDVDVVVVDAIVVVYYHRYFNYNSYSHCYNSLHTLFLSTTNLKGIGFIIMITSYHNFTFFICYFSQIPAGRERKY